MRHHRDPRRHADRRLVKILQFDVSRLDSNGDPIQGNAPTVLWQGMANIQAWLPRYNVPTAPVTGGVPERRVAARTYLPPEAPVHEDGIRILDVEKNTYYSVIATGSEMAGTGNVWRLDLGAPRILNG